MEKAGDPFGDGVIGNKLGLPDHVQELSIVHQPAGPRGETEQQIHGFESELDHPAAYGTAALHADVSPDSKSSANNAGMGR